MPRSPIYHSSPDYPALSGREVRRDALLSRMVEAWRAGHRVLGLYGPGGIGKTVASIQMAATLCSGSQRDSRLQVQVTRALWLELRICPDAGGFLSQLVDCLQEMGQHGLAQQLRQEAQPDPEPLAHALAQALGPDCLLIVDQCEAVLDDQGRVTNPYLRKLLTALFVRTGWRGLLTIRVPSSSGEAGQVTPSPTFFIADGEEDGHEVCRVDWFPVEELSTSERTTLLRLGLPSSPLRWDELNGGTQRLILTEMASHPHTFSLFLADPGNDPAATVTEIRRRATNGAGEYAALDYYVGQVPAAVRPMLELLAALEDREPWPFLEGAWQALGSTLGWPVRRAGAALSDLTRRALVEEGAEGYRVIPIVRHYLLHRAPPLGLSETLARFFHQHLTRLYEVLAKQVRDQAETLLTEKENADASQRAAELVRYHAVLRDRALRQALCRGSLRLVRGALEGLVEPVPWQLTAQLTAGRCLAYTQRLTALVEEAITRSDDDGRPAEVGACYHAIGRVCEEIHAEEQSLAAYQSALGWWERTRQPHRMGDTWVQIGRIYVGRHQWSEALSAYRTALDWWERTRQYPQMGSTWHRIGRLYADQGSWPEALTAYHTALDWQGRTHRQRESGGTWQRMGETHEAQGQLGPAALAYAQSLESLRTHNAGSKTLESVLASAQRLLAAAPPDTGSEWEQLRGVIEALQNR
ncbi:hypothetical protein CCP3SC15_20033 [Gammaproteobacteria bacterium]